MEEFELDFTKSAQENASYYFDAAKQARKKKAGAEEAISELEKKLKEAEAKESKKEGKTVRLAKKEWYEKFYWFFTSSGFLAIGGRDAVQNELINSKYFEERDLFFHADIFGASVVILKNGVEADENSKEEAAQFAASFSRAWSSGLASADVYSLEREKVSKSTNKGYLGTGSFAMSGERLWFKAMPLILYAFLQSDKFVIVPSKTFERLGIKKAVELRPGNIKKSEAAKKIARMLGYNDIDYIMQHIPSGSFQLKQSNQNK
ncbi:MAG: NFACT RNA binding domain-containing protein [Candidatus Micrarchaeia archaeon]|jgi:predicted ribosome quality control (RQC) complex YloA/Tae2 family protein